LFFRPDLGFKAFFRIGINIRNGKAGIGGTEARINNSQGDPVRFLILEKGLPPFPAGYLILFQSLTDKFFL
jgi:hypothetical protein